MADIVQVDATQGAGEPLYLGFAKVNQIITKINAIEAGATQDQSGAEIKALLEALVDKLSIAAVKETDTKKVMTATERTNVAANVVDVAAAQADIDGFDDELKNLIAHEIQQLETLGGVTTILAAQWGYVGALTTHPLGADGTAGRIPRYIELIIDNGTNASTLKCTVVSRWNGDTIAETNNIAKDATTGDFSLDVTGVNLKIKASGLTGNCVFAFGLINNNASGTDLRVIIRPDANDIQLLCKHPTAGTNLDWTTLVDGGKINTYIFYFTDA